MHILNNVILTVATTSTLLMTVAGWEQLIGTECDPDTQHGQEHNKCRGDYWGIIGCSVDGAWAPWGAGNPMDLEGLCDKETPIDVSKRKSSCWGAQCHDGIMPPQGAPATCNIPGGKTQLYCDESGSHWWICMNSADGSTTTPGQGVPKIADYICPSDQKCLKSYSDGWFDEPADKTLCKPKET